MPEHEPEKQPTRQVPPVHGDDRTGRQRLRDAVLGSPTRGQVMVAVLLAMVGFAAMTQVQSNERDDDYSGLRQADLIRVFDGISASSERAENDIAELTQTRDELESSTSRRSAALEQAREDTAVYGILAGTIPTSGPGIRITISDERGEVRATTILDVVQELRAAGAEAMEFNDRIRVIAQTALEQTPLGIEVDGELIEAPYVLDVIGEPTTLAGSLDFPDGPVESVEEDFGTLTYETPDEVLIESVVESGPGDFAEPREDQ